MYLETTECYRRMNCTEVRTVKPYNKPHYHYDDLFSILNSFNSESKVQHFFITPFHTGSTRRFFFALCVFIEC